MGFCKRNDAKIEAYLRNITSSILDHSNKALIAIK